MNIILFSSHEIAADGSVRLSDRRLQHVRGVLKAQVGDELAVGLVNGKMGTGRITRLVDEVLEMDVRLDRDPPAPLPVTVVLALPRPKVFRRVLYSLAVLGVKRIVLMNAARVEKSYWQSPFLAPDAMRHQLVRGLEQAGDTVLPEVVLKPRFKPFAEDELPALVKGDLALMAHPGAERSFPRQVSGPAMLAVGPEGGLVPYETDLLRSIGFTAVSIGERIMNVETALPVLLSRFCE